jgi:hypothetical protein
LFLNKYLDVAADQGAPERSEHLVSDEMAPGQRVFYRDHFVRG